MIEIISSGRVIKRYRSMTWFRKWIKARIEQRQGVDIMDTAGEIIGVLKFSDLVTYGSEEPGFKETLTFRWASN